jgi:hypothetical protein
VRIVESPWQYKLYKETAEATAFVVYASPAMDVQLLLTQVVRNSDAEGADLSLQKQEFIHGDVHLIP